MRTKFSARGVLGEVVGVGVDVDEAGRHDEARRVDRSPRGAVARQDADGRDPAVLDRDVGAPRAARPIHRSACPPAISRS